MYTCTGVFKSVISVKVVRFSLWVNILVLNFFHAAVYNVVTCFEQCKLLQYHMWLSYFLNNTLEISLVTNTINQYFGNWYNTDGRVFFENNEWLAYCCLQLYFYATFVNPILCTHPIAHTAGNFMIIVSEYKGPLTRKLHERQ